ncbi:PREDICTED: probable membrane-associated kinase regulator 2 [Nicotiana attenuata]|uniref:Membrane-associated kinase regulator 2 n=1 Tax=Nicotiana attenuata TaxID=49451 RepID=A0A1J6K3T7_NICAT|nr:PREDICTED: probable membrane-associated kinase regulator 2 [Nicotiana attenuata]OIT24733.1 putative membrane-associated kinase regulator 2 [Nicotiana attenuata]
MEAFSLLKYWRGGGATGVFSTDSAGANPRTVDSTTVITAVSPNSSDSDSDDEGDDGPFFDLEFTSVPEDEAEEEVKVENERCKISSELDESSENVINEGELKFTLSTSSCSSIDDGTDPNVSVSPSDDLFFKGSLVPIEPSSLLLTASEANSNFTSSLLKSATKFRVLMLKLKKPKFTAPSKIEKSEGDGDGFVSATTPKLRRKRVSESEKEEPPNLTQNKFFTVKFKVEEVPIKSLFTRDNSSKDKINSGKIEKRNPEEACSTNNATNSASDEKKFTKDVMQKYFKKVKPLYIRVSKRYGEKLKYSGQLSLPGNAATNKAGRSPPPLPPSAEAKADAVTDAAPTVEKNQKHGNIPSGLGIVRKHLGKSRSASSAVVAAAPVASNRRDDSLLQQQDAIQGAILHCKRSFNSCRDSESSILSRSASDASHEKSTSLTTDSSTLEEAKAVRN